MHDEHRRIEKIRKSRRDRARQRQEGEGGAETEAEPSSLPAATAAVEAPVPGSEVHDEGGEDPPEPPVNEVPHASGNAHKNTPNESGETQVAGEHEAAPREGEGEAGRDHGNEAGDERHSTRSPAEPSVGPS